MSTRGPQPPAEDTAWFESVHPADMRRIIETFYNVHSLISVITDLDTLLERVLDEGKRVADTEACSLLLYDEHRDDLYFQVVLGESGDSQKLKQKIRLKLSEGIAGAAATTREAVIVQDVKRDSRFFKDADKVSKFKTRNILAVPLVDHGRLVGVIEVLNKLDGDDFSETDLRIMEMFASLVATAITNARLIEENLRKERLAATGQAVAGLSHHTKNILTGVQGSVDLISHGLDRGNLEILHKGWGVLRRGLERISVVVEDMLAFSTPRKPATVACSIRDIVHDAAADYADFLNQKKIELDLQFDDMEKAFWLDPRGLYRCLLNLMSNAAFAVPTPGGKIAIRVWLSPQSDLEIEVSDNGPGIPEADRERIFQPFFSTKGSSGTGLGLAVTEKIILEHGGDITVGEGPEGGAAFHITIPQQERET